MKVKKPIKYETPNFVKNFLSWVMEDHITAQDAINMGADPDNYN